MNIFDKLSETEQDMIAEYIESYAGYDGDSISMRAPLSHILRYWSTNKVDLFNAFGGELILSKTISFTKPDNMLENEISSVINGVGYRFYRSFDFWRHNNSHIVGDYCWTLGELLYCSNLASNIWTGESFSIMTPDNHKIDIATGCKISKVLGKIARAFNLEGYEDFRIAHSQCLNQKKLTGELCVSIHPMDYMTMSDNTCDWSSCMSWQDCGDYRQGTVEMMNSPCVVVAYLKASNDMHIPGGYHWNNKKWRSLYIVNPNIILGIREYPYASDELNGTTLQWLRDIVNANTNWGPFEDTVTMVNNGREEIPVASMNRTIRLNFYTGYMYNDFYNSRPAYLSPAIPDMYELCFSGESECMECGESMCSDDQPNALVCMDCDDGIWCSECGERISKDSAIFTADGCYVCSCCYEDYYHMCPMCEEMHHASYGKEIYLKEHDQISSYHTYFCDSCLESQKFTDMFGPVETVPYGRWSWDTREAVDIKNLTPEALEMFEIWDDSDYEHFKAIVESNANSKSQASDEN